jgi:hypothetical protein
MLDYSSLFVFQFCGAAQFWMLLSGSGDQLCRDSLPALLWGVAYCPPLSLLEPFLCLFTESLGMFSSLPCTLSPVQVQHSTQPLCCLCLITVRCLFSSFVGGRVSLHRGCAGLYSWGWLGDSHMVPGAHMFVLSIDVQAGLEPVAAVRNGAKFSQCSVAWGCFPQARDSGC